MITYLTNIFKVGTANDSLLLYLYYGCCSNFLPPYLHNIMQSNKTNIKGVKHCTSNNNAINK